MKDRRESTPCAGAVAAFWDLDILLRDNVNVSNLRAARGNSHMGRAGHVCHRSIQKVGWESGPPRPLSHSLGAALRFLT